MMVALFNCICTLQLSAWMHVATGNIILTNGEYEALAILRSHKFNEQVSLRVGAVYPIAYATSLSRITENGKESGGHVTVDSFEEFVNWCRGCVSCETVDKGSDGSAASAAKKKMANIPIKQLLLYHTSPFGSYGPEIIEHCLVECGCSNMKVTKLLEDFDREQQQAQDANESRLEAVYKIFTVDSGSDVGGVGVSGPLPVQLQAQLDIPGQPGYIVYKPIKLEEDTSVASPSQAAKGLDIQVDADKDYIEFIPRLWKQYEGESVHTMKYATFGEAVDQYFCKIEDQRIHSAAVKMEANIVKKINKVRNEQETLIHQLNYQQEYMEASAMSAEMYTDEIDKIRMVINGALGAGMDWKDIQDMVDREAQVNHNPYAQLVKELQLQKNSMVLRIPNMLYEGEELEYEEVVEKNVEDTDDSDKIPLENSAPDASNETKSKKNKKNSKYHKEVKKARNPQDKQGANSLLSKVDKSSIPVNLTEYVDITIDLALSANANTSKLYAAKKAAKIKEDKTKVAAAKAIEVVEKQTSKQLDKANIKKHLQAVRKVHWFEKFNWFVTSQGYLCLSGRDAQQNELLVKRYMRPCDAYIHADIAGAASCVVRAQRIEDDSVRDAKTKGFRMIMSPMAIQEASVNTICRSVAWNNKVVIAAYWVWGSQVSKTPPTGEYLSTGSFMIYGKKNYLSPSSLEMGFGVMFRLDDASVAKHLKSDHSDDVSVQSGTATNSTSLLQKRLYKMQLEAMDAVECSGLASHNQSQSQNNSISSSNVSVTVREKAKIGKELGRKTPGGGQDSSTEVQSPTPAIVSEAEPDQVHEEVDEEELSVESGPVGNVSISDSHPHSSDDVVANIDHSDKKGNRKLTARERRLLKAGKPLDAVPEKPQAQHKITVPADTKTPAPISSNIPKKLLKGGKMNKKKAKRYAEQDEEDREIALQVLGHVKLEDTKMGKDMMEMETQVRENERQMLKQMAGVDLLENFNEIEYERVWGELSDTIRTKIQEFIDENLLKRFEIAVSELKVLALLPTEHVLPILTQYRVLIDPSPNTKKIVSKALLAAYKQTKNKSALLGHVVKEYSTKMLHVPPTERENPRESLNLEGESGVGHNTSSNDSIPENDTVQQQEEVEEHDQSEIPILSRRAAKKAEMLEIQQLLEEEGIFEEDEGRNADELMKLSGNPEPGDGLMYAVPVVGPYHTLQSYKYKVKLTPGVQKKGKAIKQALDLFIHDKNCLDIEKQLILGLTDNECVAMMLGDVKVNISSTDAMKMKNKMKQKNKK